VTALETWRRALEARAIPEPIMRAAPESPWGFPTDLFRARSDAATRAPVTPTTARGLEALPDGGTVLDVGVGGGATSLPMAAKASMIIGVDQQADMLAEFETAARSAGVEAVTVEGGWPKVAGRSPEADVAVSGHTIYNVADLGPFVLALDEHATRRVILEATDRHPLGWMADLWAGFHEVDIPDEPTIDLAITALHELGLRPERDDRAAGDEDPAGGGFETKTAAVALVRKRLCLSSDADEAIEEALGQRLRVRNGLWSAGPLARTVVTLWWDRAPD
jgi:precorrin-6B methylase 2